MLHGDDTNCTHLSRATDDFPLGVVFATHSTQNLDGDDAMRPNPRLMPFEEHTLFVTGLVTIESIGSVKSVAA